MTSSEMGSEVWAEEALSSGWYKYKTHRALVLCAGLARRMMALACESKAATDETMRAALHYNTELSIINRPDEGESPDHERLPKNTFWLTVVTTSLESLIGWEHERTNERLRHIAFNALAAVRSLCVSEGDSPDFMLTQQEVVEFRRFHSDLNKIVFNLSTGKMPDEWTEQFRSFLDELYLEPQ